MSARDKIRSFAESRSGDDELMPPGCLSYGDAREIQAEHDPTGKSQHEPGAKLDGGKVRCGLVIMGFPLALYEISRVATFGAAKYTDHGWSEVPNGEERYTDALLRHLLREGAGERTDPDTGMLHATHVAWNALARLELALRRED